VGDGVETTANGDRLLLTSKECGAVVGSEEWVNVNERQSRKMANIVSLWVEWILSSCVIPGYLPSSIFIFGTSAVLRC
jgi:hypothetical protein